MSTGPDTSAVLTTHIGPVTVRRRKTLVHRSIFTLGTTRHPFGPVTVLLEKGAMRVMIMATGPDTSAVLSTHIGPVTALWRKTLVHRPIVTLGPTLHPFGPVTVLLEKGAMRFAMRRGDTTTPTNRARPPSRKGTRGLSSRGS